MYQVASVKNNSYVIAKTNSCATYHYLKKEYITVLTNLEALPDGPKAPLPNNATIQVIHSKLLRFAESLSPDVHSNFMFTRLSNASVLSIGQL